ncbi:alpha/beta fold hydrolase [Nocardiopsis sp. N85]|uniref:alpha/beta fold hydrolase n=1 Tax=Nocardiopsis sp. N85 TaxID=3029400 RepID=UPI00237F53AB|nr:alpha/beta fold hydrolase [Nocardiopsis sp. N85]MDE3721858.1 alpha/beta fold hydrolase [Nocardiopsis sp. N85]
MTGVRTTPTGGDVHVWETAGTPRALVQLQHGYSEYAERFVTSHNTLIPHLVELGFEVWAADLEGHGRAPGRRGSLDARRAVIDHVLLRRRMRARGLPVLLFGHSLGGLITAGSVTVDPADVDGAVLTAPALLPLPPPPVRAAVDLLGLFLPTVPAPLPKQPPSRLTHLTEQIEALAEDPLFFRGRLPMRVAATALEVNAGVRRRIAHWRTPCLVVHGTEDTVTDPEQSRLFVESLPVDDKEFHPVEGGYHELLHDTAGDRVLDLITTWLEARTKR